MAGLSAGGGSKPNIVFIVSDDLGYTDIGFQNALTGQSTEFKTPNLDTLAKSGVIFRQAYATASVCGPSRAGLLTGIYQQRYGFEFNPTSAQSDNNGMPTDQVMIIERMKEIGYTTGVIGKWHLGRTQAMQPQNRGADEFFGLYGGMFGGS